MVSSHFKRSPSYVRLDIGSGFHVNKLLHGRRQESWKCQSRRCVKADLRVFKLPLLCIMCDPKRTCCVRSRQPVVQAKNYTFLLQTGKQMHPTVPWERLGPNWDGDFAIEALPSGSQGTVANAASRTVAMQRRREQRVPLVDLSAESYVARELVRVIPAAGDWSCFCSG
jgi:hypothetical protein